VNILDFLLFVSQSESPAFRKIFQLTVRNFTHGQLFPSSKESDKWTSLCTYKFRLWISLEKFYNRKSRNFCCPFWTHSCVSIL